MSLMIRRGHGIHFLWVGLLAGLLLMQTDPTHGETTHFNPTRAFKPFDLPVLDGGRHTLEDFRGRPVLLSVWASWCAPCRYELPQFQQARSELAGTYPDAVFLTINVGDGGARAKGFMKKIGVDLPVLLAGHKFVYEYDITIIPTLWILDREGKLAIRHQGWTQGTDLPAVLGEDLDTLERLSARRGTH